MDREEQTDQGGDHVTTLREKFKNPIWLRLCLLLLAFCVAYWVPLKVMAATWWDNEDYSYGFLIPLVSLYLVWERRKAMDGVALSTSWRFLPFLLFFVALSLYGILGSSGNISMPSVPIVLFLLVGFCFGTPALKNLAFPFAFLVFMVPVPAIIERYLGLFLKSVSSSLGGIMIRAVGISVNVSGNVIDLGTTQLQVVDACSGMRYLFALLALGVVYSYFFEKTLWRRVFCTLVTLPISVLMNGLRIGITGILAEYYGSQAAEGFFHGFAGWVMFMVAFACLFAVGRLLRLLFKPEPSAGTGPELTTEAKWSAAKKAKGFSAGFAVALALLVIVALLSLSTKALPPVMIKGGIRALPVSFSAWQGQQETVSPEIISASGAEDAFSATYRNTATSRDVSLYIGYRSSAFLANENFFHSPTVCLPSSGWKTDSTSTRTVQNVPFFGNLPVTEMVIEQSGRKQLVYFWFQTKDKATDDKNMNRFHLAMHAIRRDNSHDLFIRPITMIYPNETLEQAETRMDLFVRDMMAALLKFLKERQYEAK
jgi:exosortase D (VPLPA-CTERM-specific)